MYIYMIVNIAYTHACVPTYMHAYIHTYIHTGMHECIHTYIFIHTFIHIYIYSKAVYITGRGGPAFSEKTRFPHF